jgi:type IV pilus assembly protein PilM
MGLFSSTNSSYLGIDIGTSGVKMVELKKEGKHAKLISYGFSEYIDNEITDSILNENREIIKIIKSIQQKAGMTTRAAVSALPTFSVFTSIITLTNVDKKDLPSAINWEAKKVIPLPLEEMVLDWVEIKDNTPQEAGKKIYRILLTGASRTLVEKYVTIFKESQLQLISLETETLSLIRSLLGNDKSPIMLVEIGTNTSDISIIENSIPVLNRSLDVGGLTITKAIGNSLNIGMNRAEQFKYDMGISTMDTQEDIIPKTIIESLSPIVNEIKYTLNLYQNKSSRSVDKIMLSGGGSLLINFSNYLSTILNLNVVIGDPWARIAYPVELEPTLKEVGPRLSVAVGLALREM